MNVPIKKFYGNTTTMSFVKAKVQTCGHDEVEGPFTLLCEGAQNLVIYL